MKEALKLAIEGGYKHYVIEKSIMPGGMVSDKTNEQILLDPLFWQALGKALGWKTIAELERGQYISPNTRPIWQFYALRYFELKLTGGDEEQFWKDLTNTPTQQ